MQVKKDEIRNNILNAAENEFLEKGFTNASLRRIVKNAGTTLGNFYNYFANKETLFETLVESEYRLFTDFFTKHGQIERPDYLWDMTDVSQWRVVLSKLLTQIIPPFSQRFVLLMECSEGTRYQDTRNKLIQLLKEHFVEHFERFNPKKKEDAIAEIIAEQLMNGFIFILRKYSNDEVTRKRLLVDYLLVYMIGSMGLIGDWSFS